MTWTWLATPAVGLIGFAASVIAIWQVLWPIARKLKMRLGETCRPFRDKKHPHAPLADISLAIPTLLSGSYRAVTVTYPLNTHIDVLPRLP